MPPVHRWTDRPIAVPEDMVVAVLWALEDVIEMVEAGAESPYAPADDVDGGEDWLAEARKLAPADVTGGMMVVHGTPLSYARNVCDLEALGGERECERYIAEGESPLTGPDRPWDPPLCGQCPWCRCLLVRDRIDHWMDRAGVRKSPYIGDVGPRIEDDWRRAYGGVAETAGAAGPRDGA